MRKLLLFVFAALLLLSSVAWAETVGVVTHLSGVLSVKRADGTTKFLSISSTLEKGDVLSTEANAFARIRFNDNAEVVMRPLTQFVVNEYRYDEAKPQEDRSSLSILKGSLRTSSGFIGKRNRDKVDLKTPFATIGIRGTVYEIFICEAICVQDLKMDEGLYAHVLDGAIVLGNHAGNVDLPKGTMGYVATASTAPIQIELKVQMWTAIPKMSGSGDDADSANLASVNGSDSTGKSTAVNDTSDAGSSRGMGSCRVR